MTAPLEKLESAPVERGGSPGRHRRGGNGMMQKNGNKMSGWLLWVVCEVAVWGWAMGFIQLLFGGLNRVFLFWTRSDAILLAALLTLDGMLVWAAALLLRKWKNGRVARALQPLFFFWLVLLVANWFPNGRLSLLKHFPWLTGVRYYLLVWGAGLLLSAGAACCPAGRRLARAGWRSLAYAWMLPPFMATGLWWVSAPRPPTSRSPADLPPNGGGNGKPPVVLVILDMVAASEAVDGDGSVATDLPNLKAFAGTSTYFSRATAPGLQTLESIPGICMQRAVGVPGVTGDGRVLWPERENRDNTLEIKDCPLAVTRQVRRAGGRSAMCSYYLPWMDWFAGEWAWDAASTRCYYGAGPVQAAGWRKWAWRAVLIMTQWTDASKTPLAGFLKAAKVWKSASHRHYASLADDIQAEGAAYLRHVFSRGDFALLHQPLPHHPVVFDAGGAFLPRAEVSAGTYRGQLRHADTLFGQWMDALRESGLWDEAWVLVTSDHGLHDAAWSRMPGRHDKPHVPLWVKAPGQTEAAELDVPVRLDRLDALPMAIWPFAGDGSGGTP